MPKKPLVVLVPGLFGSHLRDAGGRVWLDDTALEDGGLPRLAFAAENVTPDGVIAAIYRTLVEALDPLYDVNAFDYDWRQPLATAAAGVRAAIADGLKVEGRCVHLVGHGWGGVVAVAAASDPDVFAALLQRQGRIVTLGAPFAGSWEVQRMVDGTHPLARLLAGIVTQRTTVESVTSVLAAWPALSECSAESQAGSPGRLCCRCCRRSRAPVSRPASTSRPARGRRRSISSTPMAMASSRRRTRS